jgi:hypothetical protein
MAASFPIPLLGCAVSPAQKVFSPFHLSHVYLFFEAQLTSCL